ncbi:ATP-binding protein [Mucilaginibacter sp.]|uniref:sensor histidine kinase n=1 Tax=Mucilaginibacter sp. TaxID=1882438 RepID=UPI00283C375C|nr:ATP-binding protein [Mucilaginibacter sp.]MDR3696160.1 ATP-binding protein [Mucilaginibacter sp.]
MLALLFASLLFTAILVQKTYTPANDLEQTAKTLEHNLQKNEGYVNEVLNNPELFNQLKSLTKNTGAALKYVQYFTTNKNIWFITTNNGNLSFWSGIKIIPDFPDLIKDGYSFRKESNGYYEVIKKSDGGFSAIFFIPVKFGYAFQNQYLKNTFSPNLLKGNNIDIADFTDKNVFEIYTANHSYLFSVKLKPGEINTSLLYFQLSLWILTLLSLCLLVRNICNYIAGKGFVISSVLFLGSFIILIRFINLHYGWPDFPYQLKIFSPQLYGSSAVYPSLGDLCINILLLSWFFVFLYEQRKKLIKKAISGRWSYVIYLTFIAALLAISTSLVNLFYGVVINSKISFDVTNVLNLSSFSFLGILMLCFSFMIFYLLVEIFLTVSFKLSIPNIYKTLIFIAGIILATVVSAYYQGFSLFYILWGILVSIRAYAYRSNRGELNSASLAIIVLVCAFISSIKLNYFESVKEIQTRKAFVQKLELPDDAQADFNFKRLEKQIIADSSIVRYFKDSEHDNNFLRIRLQKLYFSGYLSKYEFKVFAFDKQDEPLSTDKNFDLGVFKDMVLYSSYKVSDYFYRENESFGFLSYFAILPFMQNGERTGTLVIELKSKPIQIAPSFPGLLVDGEPDNDDEFKGYSYAFYSDNKLFNQSGNFVYDLSNNQFDGITGKYVFKKTNDNGDEWFMQFTTYSHLIYKPTERTLIVVSKENKPLIFSIASLTFFFVVFLTFSILVISSRWLWMRIRILSIKNNRFSWNFKLNLGLVLYKTRIQFSMVFAVVATLVMVGIITFLSISTEYQTQQDKTIRDKIHKIAIAFENSPYSKYLKNADEATQVDFDNFANAYSADLTLFDLDGVALVTTQPKIYEYGLQARRMNARAIINLKYLQKSEYTNEEKIGLLNYKAAFMPIRNSNNETIAYLQLPYFSNESDYKEHIGSLLNVMINVYAIVFMAIGLFAVFIARQITSPLSFIQYSLSKTIYGQKNEPIQWERNDEIGALVKEYNKMISALENSAQKLAQSERESAWREMAKQVAHEIKNPLTPLKLGLQLLDKSWKDKDPKFDQKFERFSKSFVEQIESLSSIASEFSAFAKMPETKLERLNIFEILGQAVTIFKEMDNVKIINQASDKPFFILADRDQLLRCFNNLLKNAIEATPSNKLGVIEINYMVTNKNVLLTVKDNGDGIPDGLREKIFEPNFTTKSSGTGLGLAFVKNSIENAGGKVWFETATGEGTTFYISLPGA